MKVPFVFSEKAAEDMAAIYGYSAENWGDVRADRYLEDLYRVFEKIAANPSLDRKWHERSYPYYMFEAMRHFIIYDRIPHGVLILTIEHQMRNIEAVIAAMRPEFGREVQTFRLRLTKS